MKCNSLRSDTCTRLAFLLQQDNDATTHADIDAQCYTVWQEVSHAPWLCSSDIPTGPGICRWNFCSKRIIVDQASSRATGPKWETEPPTFSSSLKALPCPVDAMSSFRHAFHSVYKAGAEMVLPVRRDSAFKEEGVRHPTLSPANRGCLRSRVLFALTFESARLLSVCRSSPLRSSFFPAIISSVRVQLGRGAIQTQELCLRHVHFDCLQAGFLLTEFLTKSLTKSLSEA